MYLGQMSKVALYNDYTLKICITLCFSGQVCQQMDSFNYVFNPYLSPVGQRKICFI